MNEIDKNVHSMHCDLHTKKGSWGMLSSFKRGDFKVSDLNFESNKSLGRKVCLFLEQQNFLEFSDFLLSIFMLSFL